MKLRLLLSVALTMTVASRQNSSVFAQVSQTAPDNSTTVTDAPAAVTACEQINLVSIDVRGAPNTFCVPTNTCNSNYIGSCPGAGAVDRKGVALPSGSCCASLESTGVVGCVSLALVQSSAFQCISHAGASDTAPVVDISTATPLPTTATPAPTTAVPPATAAPTSTPATTSDGSNEGSSGVAGESSPPETSTPAPETSTPVPPATTTTMPSSSPTTIPITRDVTPNKLNLAASSSSSSSSGSSSGSLEPEAGVDPTVSVPAIVPRPATTASTAPPPAPTGPLEMLAPIPDDLGSPMLGNVATVGTEATSAKNPNTKPLSATGSNSSTSSASDLAGSINDNIVLVLVLGTVGSVAVVLGALLLRRRSSAGSSSVSTTAVTGSATSRTGKAPNAAATDLDLPKMTLDGDEDMLEDLQFRQTNAFSPIFVQPTHSYTETRTPGNDRQSYFL